MANARPSRQQHHVVYLVHLCNQSIDLVLPVPQVTSLHEVLEFPRPEPARWVAQLERPQEVADLLEVRAHGEDLMDQVLHADNTVLAQVVFDDLVVGEGNALLLDLAISTLVDELANSLEVGVAVGNVWLNDLEHLQSCLCEADEDAVVDLKQTEELEDFAGLRRDLVDTG